MSFKESIAFKIIVTVASVIVFVILIDKIIMPWYVDLGEEINMPDVVQSELSEAKINLEKQGFRVYIADSVYDANFAEGTIVDQMPAAYSTVKRSRNVYLTVSIGDKPITMPNLFSMSPRDAELKLKASGLELRSVLQAYNSNYPEGIVIAQSFPHGERVKKNTKITITISLGTMPRDKKIPNLIGKSLSAAQQQLKQLGVSVNEIEYEENNAYLPNTVLKQGLKEGQPIEDNTEISLTVSKLFTEE